MSVVVAIKKDDIIYFGCDSQVTKGGTRTTLKNPNNYKIWKIKGAENALMGHVGMVRDATVIRIMDDLIPEYYQLKDSVDFKFVVRDIYPSIISELKRYGYVANSENSKLDYLDSSFLFAYKDKLFSLGQDGSVIEVEDCCAIGSGSPEAMGSLLTTEGLKPEERIIKAIKASATNDIYVDYPIIISNTKTTEFKVINEKDIKEHLVKEK